MRTNDHFSYEPIMLAPKESYFTFDLMACSDGHIALSLTPGLFTQDTYEVVIGGWDNKRYHGL